MWNKTHTWRNWTLQNKREKRVTLISPHSCKRWWLMDKSYRERERGTWVAGKRGSAWHSEEGEKWKLEKHEWWGIVVPRKGTRIPLFLLFFPCLTVSESEGINKNKKASKIEREREREKITELTPHPTNKDTLFSDPALFVVSLYPFSFKSIPFIF